MAGLAGWRDAALILLSLEALLGGAVVGLVLYKGLRGLTQLIEQLRPVLFQVRLGTWKVCDRINHNMRALAAPFVRLHSVAAGARRALQILGPLSLRRAERRGNLPSSSEAESA